LLFISLFSFLCLLFLISRTGGRTQHLILVKEALYYLTCIPSHFLMVSCGLFEYL
jgi:hypothetical protein